MRAFLLIFLSLSLVSCQNTPATDVKTSASEKVLQIGGPCEGCEAALEYGKRSLSWVDTLPEFLQNEPKMKVFGVVYQQDGSTPAPGVILYFYHTNREGLYLAKDEKSYWGKRHGYLRTLLKTDDQGRYTLFTFRPAAYPSGSEAEHIHLTVKEKDKTPYYLDSFYFADDPLLSPKIRAALSNRGGSGVVSPQNESGLLLVERDIILGKNIPDYPK